LPLPNVAPHFHRWYNVAPEMKTVSAEAKAAEDAALDEINQLIVRWEQQR